MTKKDEMRELMTRVKAEGTEFTDRIIGMTVIIDMAIHSLNHGQKGRASCITKVSVQNK